uniref:Zinc finger protein 569 n=1 Tax=Cacopsylla melanoneura TaxID=428564 RepID=A0A8D8XGM9_9HEMI
MYVRYNHHMKYVHGDAKPTCHVCGKKVSSKEFLAVHMNMHTGEKPFSCEYCERAFASKKTLVIHVRGHTGESPFKCTVCPKAFKQRSALTGHYKSRHPGVKPPCKKSSESYNYSATSLGNIM